MRGMRRPRSDIVKGRGKSDKWKGNGERNGRRE
jgi:hypothetical protein